MSLDLNKTSNAEKSNEMDTEEVKQQFPNPKEDKEDGELDDEEEDYDDVDEVDPVYENKITNQKEEVGKSNVENDSNHVKSEFKETNELLANNLQSLKQFQQEQINISNETKENKEVVLATIPPIRSQLVEDEYDDDDDYDDEYSLSNKRLKIDEDDSNNLPSTSNLTSETQVRSGEVLVNVLVDSCETSSIESNRVQEAPVEQMDCDQTLIMQQTVEEKLDDQTTSSNGQTATTTTTAIQNQADDNKNEAEVEKITSGANKQIDIENEMESDDAPTRSSSALTNISSISASSSASKLNETNGEAQPNETPTNLEAESISTDSNSNKTVVESGADTTNSTSSIETKIAKLETDTNADKSDESKAESAEQSSNKLKVPPLKIICSNPNGGLPYIKSEQQAKQAAKANEAESSSASTSNITLDMPLTRNKANKARVVSPITTTSANSTTPTRTTPTRRSQLVNSQSHQANVATSNVLNANQGRSSPVVNPTNNPINNNITSEIALQNGESNGESAADNLTRRKLRSHTRQLQGGETSASPLTLPSETTSTTNNSQEMSTELSNSNQQQPSTKEENKPSEAYGTNELDTALKSDSIANTSETLNTRKRRYRTQQQQHLSQTTTNNKDNNVDPTDQKSNNQSLSSSTNQVSNESTQMETTSNNESSEIQTNSDQNNCPSEISNSNQSASLVTTSNNNNNSGSEQISSESNPTSNSTNTESILNIKPSSCIKKYLEIKNDLLKRRDSLIKTQIEWKYPKNFKEFFLNKKNYLIQQNKEIQQSIPFFKTPNDLHEELKEYFTKQERERYSLRLRHRIEQDKLSILYEQEILRCFLNFGRELSNQPMPLGFCSVFNDDENYSQHNSYLYSNEKVKISNQNSCNSNSNSDDLCPTESTVSNVNEEKLLNSLTQTNNKFQKFKDDLIKRQLNESDSLHAVQKMDFQSKYSELSHKHKLATNSQSNTNSANKLMNVNAVSSPFLLKQTDIHVPIVHVNSKFELFDLSQLMSCYQYSANTNSNNNHNNNFTNTNAD